MTIQIKPDYSMHIGVRKPIYKKNLLKDNIIHKIMSFSRKEKERIIIFGMSALIIIVMLIVRGV